MKGRGILLVTEVHLREKGTYVDTVYATLDPVNMTGYISGRHYRRYRVSYIWNVPKQTIDIVARHTNPWENFHIAISMKTIRDSLTESYMEYTKRATEV